MVILPWGKSQEYIFSNKPSCFSFFMDYFHGIYLTSFGNRTGFYKIQGILNYGMEVMVWNLSRINIIKS